MSYVNPAALPINSRTGNDPYFPRLAVLSLICKFSENHVEKEETRDRASSLRLAIDFDTAYLTARELE